MLPVYSLRMGPEEHVADSINHLLLPYKAIELQLSRGKRSNLHVDTLPCRPARTRHTRISPHGRKPRRFQKTHTDTHRHNTTQRHITQTTRTTRNTCKKRKKEKKTNRHRRRHRHRQGQTLVSLRASTRVCTIQAFVPRC